MKKAKLVRYLIIIIFCALITPMAALADLGPKPTAEINVTLNGAPIEDKNFEARMFTCEAKIDTEATPRQKSKVDTIEYDAARKCYWQSALMAWGGDCLDSKCNFNYFLPEKFRLGVYLPSSDKLYYSTEVTRNNFNSTFMADLKTDGTIDLKETTSLLKSDLLPKIYRFLLAFVLTFILEIVVALIFLRLTKLNRKILKAIMIGNVITHPLVWFVFPLIFRGLFLSILFGELFALFAEMWFIRKLNKDAITIRQAFWLSLIINLTSWIVGGLIYQVIMLLTEKIY